MFRKNPLKEKVLEKWISRLTSLEKDWAKTQVAEQQSITTIDDVPVVTIAPGSGFTKEVAEQIRADFSGEGNDASHALYVLNWWAARIACYYYPVEGNTTLYEVLSRYYTKYNIGSYYEIALDAALQIDHYETLRHFGQMAQVHPLYHRPWGNVSPAQLIASLQSIEVNLSTEKVFKPAFHDVVLPMHDDCAWVYVNPEDKKKEAVSLQDCAAPQDKYAMLLALRQSVGSGYYQSLLHVEIAFNKKHFFDRRKDTASSFIATVKIPSIMVQCRGTANSKPKPEMHQYIVPLLSQSWIGQVIRPEYRSNDTFMLKDLTPHQLEELNQLNPLLFDSFRFLELYGTNYSRSIIIEILEKVNLPVNAAIEIMESRYSQPIRLSAIKALGQYLRGADKAYRSKIFSVLRKFLLNSNTMLYIEAITDVLRSQEEGKRIIYQFITKRAEMLDKEPALFTVLMHKVIKSAGYRRHALDQRSTKLLVSFIRKMKLNAITYFLYKTNLVANLTEVFQITPAQQGGPLPGTSMGQEPPPKKFVLTEEARYLETVLIYYALALPKFDTWIHSLPRDLKTEYVGWGRYRDTGFPNHPVATLPLIRALLQASRFPKQHATASGIASDILSSLSYLPTTYGDVPSGCQIDPKVVKKLLLREIETYKSTNAYTMLNTFVKYRRNPLKRFNPKLTKKGKHVYADEQPLRDASVEILAPNILVVGPLGPMAELFDIHRDSYLLYFLIDSTDRNKMIERIQDGDMAVFPARRAISGPGTIEMFWKNPFTRKLAGAVQFIKLDESTIVITHMAVKPKWRRSRLNWKMMDELKQRYPDKILKFHDLTNEGRAFMTAYGGEEYKVD